MKKMTKKKKIEKAKKYRDLVNKEEQERYIRENILLVSVNKS
jgi:hypothetical protein